MPHDSRELARALFEEAGDALVLFDPDTGLVADANPLALQLGGWERDAVRGRPAADLFERAGGGADPGLCEGARHGAPYHAPAGTRLRTSRPDVTVPVDVTVTRLHVSPRPLGLITARDLRAEQAARQRLEQAEEKFRRIFENATEGIFQSTPDGRFVTANPALARMLGYESPAELIALVGDIGRQLHVHPERRADMVRLLTEQGSVNGFEAEVYRKDGSTLWASLNGHAIRDATGAVLYFEGMVEDVTQRKRAEETLSARARQQEAVAEIGQRALALTDLSRVMAEACTLTGRTLAVDRVAVWELLPSGHELRLRAGVGWPAGAVRSALIPAGTGSPAGYALAANDAVVVEDLHADPRCGAPALYREQGLASGACAVIQAPGGAYGVLAAYSARRRAFSPDDAHFLRAVANVLAAAIDRHASEAARAHTEAEFRLAREIQQNLFPAVPPRVAGFDIGGMSFPAEATGGDYYDYMPLADGSVGVAIGDVTGHGFGPALLMASTRAYLRGLAQIHHDVGQILTRVNHILALDTGGDAFITLLLARLDAVARTFTHASAGHLTCYLLGASGETRQLIKSTGTPLGIDPDSRIETAPTVRLAPGDLVVLLTDGVVEACTPQEDVFGIQAALEVVRAHRHEPAAAIVDALYTAVCAFAAGEAARDDITVVIIKVLDPV